MEETAFAWSILIISFVITSIVFFFLKKTLISHLQILENLGHNYDSQRKLIGSYFSQSLISENADEVKAVIESRFIDV